MKGAAARPAAEPHLIVLVIATAIAQLAMTSFLPAMAADMDVDYATVQLTVPVYLVSVAILQLVIGPFSDRFGRRPAMLGSTCLFLLGTAAAALAPTVGLHLVARVLQGFAIAGVVGQARLGGQRLGSRRNLSHGLWRARLRCRRGASFEHFRPVAPRLDHVTDVVRICGDRHGYDARRRRSAIAGLGREPMPMSAGASQPGTAGALGYKACAAIRSVPCR